MTIGKSRAVLEDFTEETRFFPFQGLGQGRHGLAQHPPRWIEFDTWMGFDGFYWVETIQWIKTAH